MAKKQKFQKEFEMHCSPRILFNYLSTPSGLSEWFADDVIVHDNIFTFKWTGTELKAKVVHKRDNVMVRFKWLDESEEGFFEFEILTDDLTSDVALLITDFSTPEDQEESERLWETQVHNLRQIIGS
ncbi:MAG TPA: START-like domain-containing protein [Bacteroidia bacterium]|nr:START-like domain-containing protein [Bacteroidia bacterium]